MMTLRIDSVVCDLPPQESLPHFGVMYDLAALADPESGRTGRAITFRLPSTPRNDAVMCRAADLHCGEGFNARRHEAEVEVDGTVLLAGAAVLEAVEAAALPVTEGPPDAEEGAVCGGSGRLSYVVRVEGDAAAWAETAARSDFGEIGIGYGAVLDGTTIQNSWSDSSPVKFLPVRRDSYDDAAGTTSIYPPQRIGSVEDYHPFISVAALMEAIFAAGGYRAAGGFMQGGLLRSLYMSGRYASASTERVTSSMGFCAGRRAEAGAEADGMGRVYLSPLVLANSLGNFVDTTDTAAGSDLQPNARTLAIDGSGVRFTPTSEVAVGFEFRLDYRTDYRILSRERLAGFDSLYVDSGCDIAFRLANPFIDRRDALTAGTAYRCVVFGHVEGQSYRVVCRYGGQTAVAAAFSARTAQVSIPAAATGAQCELQLQAADGSYAPYADDWALYDGHVGETGSTDVQVTLRSAPERLAAGSEKSFVRMYLHGAEPGQRITLGTGCRLRPVFSAAPAAGSHVTFADVAHHDVTGAELLAAVGQMFNLVFRSDTVRRTVTVESLDDYLRDDVVDWRGRVVTGAAAEAADMAAAVHERRTLAYRSEGGPVARYEERTGGRVGEWSFTTASQAALRGVKRMRNSLFCPTLNAVGVYASAPSASVPQVGDRDSTLDADFGARVVLYRGMRPLPAGERWGFPSYGTSYPYAAFHHAAEQRDGTLAAAGDGRFTLCFEDRDGAVGLHSHYDRAWRREAGRRQLRVTVRLAAHELAALLDGAADGGNVRSKFRLGWGAETALYRLAAVEGYDAATGQARCLMLRETED
ncbi:MAG: hypothetical protein MR292_03760 [Alistipes sp.]|nr:hypothetical protein [Alistipes sp.]